MKVDRFPVARKRAVALGAAALAAVVACSSEPTEQDVAAASVGFSYMDLDVAEGSVQTGAGAEVTMRGRTLALGGQPIAVGDKLRGVGLAKGDLSVVDLSAQTGKVRILSIVPSLDTPVCEQQTHYLSEKSGNLSDDVELVTVSIDTPFAQSRFAKEAGTDNVTFLSDYRGAAFGRTHGLFVEAPSFLARAVIVLDAENVVRYLQVTPELTAMPDLDQAFDFARRLVEESKKAS